MKKISLFIGFITILSFQSCKKDESVKEPVPTKTLMQGTWELTAATDNEGKDILSKVAFPVTVVQLNNSNGMMGTQSPMFTYIVYGGSKWIEVAGKIGQAFDYANFQFSDGEFFVGDGTPNFFTVEAKLKATAAAGNLGSILTAFGVEAPFINETIYHKFSNVKVTFPGHDPVESDVTTMVWEFDNLTVGKYNIKDAEGNPALWDGWPTGSFTKSTFTFTKRIKTVIDVVKEHN